MKTGVKPQPPRIPKIGFVSLGCPKALVDSERILTRLRAEGYQIAPEYEGADAVVVNTCGFIDSARAESLEAIGEALNKNGKVIVTGCLGKDEELIRKEHPNVLAVTGPHQYEDVMAAIHTVQPKPHDPITDLVPPSGIRLTPRHYAYLKISEGCNNSCRFCIIPDLRGRLKSRPAGEVLREAERLRDAGVSELLVISQDTSAYGLDLKYEKSTWHDREISARFLDLAGALGELGIWIRLHYVYPYPHVDNVIDLMSDGKILPYLDIPFQHASPAVLNAMRRPAATEKTLDRIRSWREKCPELSIRSSFIVGFPGEGEAEFEELLAWLKEARLNRVGCFKYENVEGARSNALPNHVPSDLIEDRWHRLMQTQRDISRELLAEKVGRTIEVIIDEVDEEGAIGRSKADAPEIDGAVFLNGEKHAAAGDIVQVTVEHADDYDLWARRSGN